MSSKEGKKVRPCPRPPEAYTVTGQMRATVQQEGGAEPRTWAPRLATWKIRKQERGSPAPLPSHGASQGAQGLRLHWLLEKVKEVLTVMFLKLRGEKTQRGRVLAPATWGLGEAPCSQALLGEPEAEF